MDLAKSRVISPDFLKQIEVDPDSMLTCEDREIFHKINVRFQSLFTPQPGKYNGGHGYIDNKLQFATPPPPNSMAISPHIQTYRNSRARKTI